MIEVLAKVISATSVAIKSSISDERVCQVQSYTRTCYINKILQCEKRDIVNMCEKSKRQKLSDLIVSL